MDANLEVKTNKMNSAFAYLFDVDSNGYMHNIHNHFKKLSINTLDVININLDTPNDPKLIKLANDLTIQKRERFTTLLKKYQETSASSYKDMPRLDKDIIQHQILIYLE